MKLINTRSTPGDTHDTVMGIAEDYIDCIKKIQPEGPYILFGWSGGGIIATAMAEKLQVRGEIAGVYMIDSLCPTFIQAMAPGVFIEKYLKKLLCDTKNEYLSRQLGNSRSKLETWIDALIQDIQEAQKHNHPITSKPRLVHQIFNQTESLLDKNQDSEFIKQLDTIRQTIIAWLGYRPPEKLENINLITTSSSVEEWKEEFLGWPSTLIKSPIKTGGGTNHTNHFSLMQDPEIIKLLNLVARINDLRDILNKLQKKRLAQQSRIVTIDQLDLQAEKLFNLATNFTCSERESDHPPKFKKSCEEIKRHLDSHNESNSLPQSYRLLFVKFAVKHYPDQKQEKQETASASSCKSLHDEFTRGKSEQNILANLNLIKLIFLKLDFTCPNFNYHSYFIWRRTCLVLIRLFIKMSNDKKITPSRQDINVLIRLKNDAEMFKSLFEQFKNSMLLLHLFDNCKSSLATFTSETRAQIPHIESQIQEGLLENINKMRKEAFEHYRQIMMSGEFRINHTVVNEWFKPFYEASRTFNFFTQPYGFLITGDSFDKRMKYDDRVYLLVDDRNNPKIGGHYKIGDGSDVETQKARQQHINFLNNRVSQQANSVVLSAIDSSSLSANISLFKSFPLPDRCLTTQFIYPFPYSKYDEIKKAKLILPFTRYNITYFRKQLLQLVGKSYIIHFYDIDHTNNDFLLITYLLMPEDYNKIIKLDYINIRYLFGYCTKRTYRLPSDLRIFSPLEKIWWFWMGDAPVQQYRYPKQLKERNIFPSDYVVTKSSNAIRLFPKYVSFSSIGANKKISEAFSDPRSTPFLSRSVGSETLQHNVLESLGDVLGYSMFQSVRDKHAEDETTSKDEISKLRLELNRLMLQAVQNQNNTLANTLIELEAHYRVLQSLLAIICADKDDKYPSIQLINRDTIENIFNQYNGGDLYVDEEIEQRLTGLTSNFRHFITKTEENPDFYPVYQDISNILKLLSDLIEYFKFALHQDEDKVTDQDEQKQSENYSYMDSSQLRFFPPQQKSGNSSQASNPNQPANCCLI